MSQNSDTEKAVRRITVLGMGLNTLLTILKLTVGLLFHSHACIADAIHSLSDFITDIAVLACVRLWSAPADSSHPHGHQRIEAIVTLFIGILLGLAAFRLGWDAVKNIHLNNPPSVRFGWPVFLVALASVLTKELLYQWTISVGQATHSSAVVANAWHHRSDALSSLPVLIVAIVHYFWPDIRCLDSMATLLISCMLLHTAWQISWPCLKELSDEGVSPAELEQIHQLATSVTGVEDAHEIRTRKVGGGITLDMHILVNRAMSVEDGHRICEEVTELIQRKMPIVLDVLTHLEPLDPVDLQAKIEEIARLVPGVLDIHGVRIRTVLNGYDTDLHLMLDPEMTILQGHQICQQVKKQLIQSSLGISNVLIHMEPRMKV